MGNANNRSTSSRLKITWRSLEDIKPFATNPRIHAPASIEKIANSIAAFGFRNPILIDASAEVIAGHGRLLAAQQLNLRRVPVIDCSDLSAEQVRALRLADNRTAQESTWDPELLNGEIAALLACNYSLEPCGFDPEELAGYQALLPLVDSQLEVVPEVPAEPITTYGDFIELGPHRLLCGDSTKSEDVARLMDGKRATLMATDPPYLVDYCGGNHPQTWANGGKLGKPTSKNWDHYKDAEQSVEFFRSFLAAGLEVALSERAPVYQWFGMMRAPLVYEAWLKAGLLTHQVVIWAKSRKVLGRCDFMWDYEPALYGWRAGKRPAARRRPPAAATAVWQIASTIEDGAGSVHPTMKPLECFRRPITYHTLPGEIIYEPFAGSGTALIAAEMAGRVCYAMEISPAFCDVICERYRRLTGTEAVRHG